MEIDLKLLDSITDIINKYIDTFGLIFFTYPEVNINPKSIKVSCEFKFKSADSDEYICLTPIRVHNSGDLPLKILFSDTEKDFYTLCIKCILDFVFTVFPKYMESGNPEDLKMNKKE